MVFKTAHNPDRITNPGEHGTESHQIELLHHKQQTTCSKMTMC
jgi:hypothetical protein